MAPHPSQPLSAGNGGECFSPLMNPHALTQQISSRLDISGAGMTRRACLLAITAVLCLLLAPLTAFAAKTGISVTDVRYWSLGDVTRVAIQMTGDFEYSPGVLPNPKRVYFDIASSRQKVSSANPHVIVVDDGLVQEIRVAQFRRTITRVVLELTGDLQYTCSRLSNPSRLMVEVRSKNPPKPETAAQAAAQPPVKVEKPPAPPELKTVKQQPIQAAVTQPEPVPRRAAIKKPESPPEQVAGKAPDSKPETKQAVQEAEKKPEVAKAPPPKPAAANPPAKELTFPTLTEKKPSASEMAKLLTPTRKLPPPGTGTPEPAVTQPGTPKKVPEVKSAAPPAPEPEAAEKTELAADSVNPPSAEPEDEIIAKPAARNRSGSHSLTRVLGLKLSRIVIDPGHGGRDTGTIGPTGLREKEVTLDVAKRLAGLIKDRMGSEVILTRSKDEKVSLEARTQIANDEQADLFLSIHVNSSRYRSVNGVETFYLNFTRSRADLEVAARENAGSNRSIHELSGLVQKIALDDKVQESRDFASNVQTAVHNLAKKKNARARNRGVKKAPFVVLIGAQMPSILVELGFISNPSEEKLMKSAEHRQAMAEALYEGLSKYASTLSHFQVAKSTGATADGSRPD